MGNVVEKMLSKPIATAVVVGCIVGGAVKIIAAVKDKKESNT